MALPFFIAHQYNKNLLQSLVKKWIKSGKE